MVPSRRGLLSVSQRMSRTMARKSWSSMRVQIGLRDDGLSGLTRYERIGDDPDDDIPNK